MFFFKIHAKRRFLTVLSYTLIVLPLIVSACGVKASTKPIPAYPVLTWEEGSELKVAFLDLSEGEATLILTSWETLLIDTGSESSWPELKAVLDGWRIKRLDRVFLSSPDDPWSGNAHKLQETYQVGHFMLAPGWSQKILFTKQLPSDKIVIVQSGDGLQLKNGARIDVLNPSDPIPLSPHNQSLVLRLTYGEIRFLFTGAVDEHMEKALITKYNMHTEVLKVSSCGAPWGTSEQFLRESDPQVAVKFSNCGMRFDDAPTRRRLLAQWVELYETAEDGAVIMDVHRDDYDVSYMQREKH